MEKLINHAVLSLDFWQDTVTYEGRTMPAGTIGCEVLNIPDAAIIALEPPCGLMNRLLLGMNTGAVEPELLPHVLEAAGEILSFMAATPPFSRLDRDYFEGKMKAVFSAEALEDTKVYLRLSQQEQLLCSMNGQHSPALQMIRMTQVLGHLSYTQRGSNLCRSGQIHFRPYRGKGLGNMPDIPRGLFLVWTKMNSALTAKHLWARHFRGIFGVCEAGGLTPTNERTPKSAGKGRPQAAEVRSPLGISSGNIRTRCSNSPGC